MKRVKTKPKTQKRITLTVTELNRIKRDVTRTTTQKAMLLILLATADEVGLTDDDMVAVWTRADRYGGYIDNHIVKLRELQKALEKATGTTMEGW